jgi:hypothetical protein
MPDAPPCAAVPDTTFKWAPDPGTGRRERCTTLEALP